MYLKYGTLILLIVSSIQQIDCKAVDLQHQEPIVSKQLGQMIDNIKKERSLNVSYLFSENSLKAYEYYRSLIEMKMFDPLQIKIKFIKKAMPNGQIYNIPIDSTLNHYFIGK